LSALHGAVAIPFVEQEEEDPPIADFVDALTELPVSPNIFVDALQEHPVASAIPQFRFSHVPPSHITGVRRWLGSCEPQHNKFHHRQPALLDLWAHLNTFMSPANRRSIHLVHCTFARGMLCSPLMLTWPWQPYRHHRWGFGSLSRDRSSTTVIPTFHHIFHHLWPFLDPLDRSHCQLSSSSLLRYSFQRVHAVTQLIACLQAARSAPMKPLYTSIQHAHACLAVRFYDLISTTAISSVGFRVNLLIDIENGRTILMHWNHLVAWAGLVDCRQLTTTEDHGPRSPTRRAVRESPT
jgi:hypothetical protein